MLPVVARESCVLNVVRSLSSVLAKVGLTHRLGPRCPDLRCRHELVAGVVSRKARNIVGRPTLKRL